MSEAAEKLKPMLAALAPEERAELVEYLLELNDESTDKEISQQEWEEEWVAEANRRLEAMRSGEASGLPAEEVMRRMKEKYG